MKHYRFLISIISVLMVSCSPLAGPPEPSDPAPSASVQTPQLTQSATTPTAGEAPTAIATPALIATVMAGGEKQIESSLLSPDGKWRAEVVIYDCAPVGDTDRIAYEQLALIQVRNGIDKLLDSQLINCGGLGAYGLSGLFWSPNSRYFYYTDAREGVPDGCGFWAPPIVRLDSASLKSERLGGGLLSPDGSKLAIRQDQDIVVWDVDQGELARSPAAIDMSQIGQIIWSPDSRSVVYLQTTSTCPLSGKSYVVRLDLPELEPVLQLESDIPLFASMSWDVSDALRLFDQDGAEWRYDFATSALIPVP